MRLRWLGCLVAAAPDGFELPEIRLFMYILHDVLR
jgi:hypothetical protein